MTQSTVAAKTIRKFRLVWAFAVLGVIAGVLLVAGRAHAETLGFSLSSSPAAGAEPSDISVLVLDDSTGQAINDASVSVGDTLQDDGPSRGKTGAQGTWLVKGALARGPRALTVNKDGYASLSISGLQSAQVTVYLKALPHVASAAGDTVIASGEMPNWPNVGDGNTVTAGLAFRSLSALDLLHFTTESFISPLKDTIDVFGSHDIPSNFMIPDQDVPVLFTSIHVSKPSFRLPVARGKQVQLAGVQGTIAVGDILSIVQGGGKISMALLNKLTLTHAGLTAPMATDSDFHATIDATNELNPRYQVTPNVPPFAADVLVAAATDMDGSRSVLLPTDIKLAASASSPSQVQTVNLSGPDSSVGAVHDVLTIAMADKGHRLSGIVSGGADSRVAPGEYLNADELADAPTVPDTISLQPLRTGLSAVVYESQGAAVWYVYALPGTDASQVPARRLPASTQVTSYSVMQLDFGSSFDARTVDGQTVMTKLQRFSRSSAKVGQPQPDLFN